MESAWLNFLTDQFDLSKISQVLIYTDQDQFWLLGGLLDTLRRKQIPVSAQFLDELSPEDARDILNSFGNLQEDTIILGIFSEFNRNLDFINSIFPPLRPLANYSGYSIVSLQEFPSNNYTDFLENDYTQSISLLDRYTKLIHAGEKIKIIAESNTDFELQFASNLQHFPFHSSFGRNILFPATELIAEVDPDSVSGIIVVDGTIGPFYSRRQLIDPFGKVYYPIILTIEYGKVKNIRGTDRFVPRLRKILFGTPEIERKITKLGIGIGPNLDLTGNVIVDKMLSNTCNVSIGSRELDLLFTFPRFTLL